ncbi:ParB/Sulfiredoxin [Tirmania nivea]|nr:ParB/Sulfiredoxin [Tirmania nivea]
MFITSCNQSSYPSIPKPIPAQFPLVAKTFNSELHSTFSQPVPVPVLEFERLSLSLGAKQTTSRQNPSISPGSNSNSNLGYKFETETEFKHSSFISAPIQDMTTVPNQQNMSWEPTSTPPQPPSVPSHPTSSLQSRLTSRTTFLPLSLLLRPLPPQQLDQAKVSSMLHTLSQSSSPDSPSPTSLPPVDVLYYKSPKTGREFYFAFGGCHRLSAWERAGREVVECKVMRVTRGMLGGYLGGSLGRVLGEED